LSRMLKLLVLAVCVLMLLEVSAQMKGKQLDRATYDRWKTKLGPATFEKVAGTDVTATPPAPDHRVTDALNKGKDQVIGVIKGDVGGCKTKMLGKGGDFFKVDTAAGVSQDVMTKMKGDLRPCLEDMGFQNVSNFDDTEAALVLKQLRGPVEKFTRETMLDLVKQQPTGGDNGFNSIKARLYQSPVTGVEVRKKLEAAGGDIEKEKEILLRDLDKASREAGPPKDATELAKYAAKASGESDAAMAYVTDQVVKYCPAAVMEQRRFKMPKLCRQAFDEQLKEALLENEKTIRGDDSANIELKDGAHTLKDRVRKEKMKKLAQDEENELLEEVAEECKVLGGTDAAESDAACGKMLPACGCLASRAEAAGLGVDSKKCEIFKARQCGRAVQESEDTCVFNVAATDDTTMLTAMAGASSKMEEKARQLGLSDNIKFEVEESSDPKAALRVEVENKAHGGADKIMCTEYGEAENPKIMDAIKMVIDKTVNERRLGRQLLAITDDDVSITVRSAFTTTTTDSAASCSYESVIDVCKQNRKGWEWTCESISACNPESFCGTGTVYDQGAKLCMPTAA